MDVPIFASGIQDIGAKPMSEQVVPKDSAMVTMVMDRTQWLDSDAKVHVAVEGSLDGGKTWLSVGEFTAEGGAVPLPIKEAAVDVAVSVIGVDEKVATESAARFYFSQPDKLNRLVRGVVTVSGKSFESAVKLVV